MRLRILGVLVLIVAVAGTVNYLRPIPAAAASPSVAPSDVVTGTAPTLPFPSHGSGAVAVQGLGFIGSSGNEQPAAAASVTKVMTALVLLEDKPLKKGESGPTITLTIADVQSYQNDVAGGQSTVRVEAGEPLSELQLLEGMLIPSANNFAETLARWDTGSLDSFVTKMNAKATSLHMTHTKFADVSGASPLTISTPSDLLTLGMVAMREQEVMAQIVSLGQVDLPVAGTVYNTNRVLAQSGIFGIKTGHLTTGANFLFGANVSVDGHTIVVYGCVMGQPTIDAAFSASQTLINAMSSALHVRRVLARNQTVATYSTEWGEQADLVSYDDVDLVEWPGMILRQNVTAKAIVVDHPIPPGTVEGNDHVVLGDYVLDVPLVTATQLYPPGRFWRLTRFTF